VNRVTVTLDPQAPAAEPLRFDAGGELKLLDWNVQWDAGTRRAFSRSPAGAVGSRWLQISAPDGSTAASWRTAPLLEPGEYQCTGKARTEEAHAPGGGVTLRASGRSGANVVSDAPESTILTYDFTMSALGYLELVCELRGDHGNARFDLDSLKLIRKSKATRLQRQE
jgi:hypothetical protein